MEKLFAKLRMGWAIEEIRGQHWIDRAWVTLVAVFLWSIIALALVMTLFDHPGKWVAFVLLVVFTVLWTFVMVLSYYYLLRRRLSS